MKKVIVVISLLCVVFIFSSPCLAANTVLPDGTNIDYVFMNAVINLAPGATSAIIAVPTAHIYTTSYAVTCTAADPKLICTSACSPHEYGVAACENFWIANGGDKIGVRVSNVGGATVPVIIHVHIIGE